MANDGAGNGWYADSWYGNSTVAGRAPRSRDDVAAARRAGALLERPPRRHEPGAGPGMRGFVRRYGWRAYALPVLFVFTIVALATMKTTPRARVLPGTAPHTPAASPAAPAAAPPSTAASKTRAAAVPATPSAVTSGAALNNSAALPAGAPYTRQGDGSFQVIKGAGPVVGRRPGAHLYRYDVEIENGISGVDAAAFARTVQRVLSDPRSWAGHTWQGQPVALQRVDSGPMDFHVSLTSALTVRQYCGYETKIETSCYAKAYTVAGLDVNRVFLNVSRWVRGAAAYAGDVSTYRVYMINHEDGHALGHEHAHECLPNGMAPVMMQQTIGLRSVVTGNDCTANPWPYPRGVRGTPGAEQPDTAENSEVSLIGD